MTSSHKVLTRMQTRVARLSADLGGYLDVFNAAALFTGPSVYFHNKTVGIRGNCGTVAQTLQSDEFFDNLYATLTAWGMHRMGPGNTKLLELDEIKRSFHAQADQLRELEHLSLAELDVAAAGEAATQVWGIITRLHVSPAEAQIVANSKALHHVLPALVPPIDHAYTYNFFYDRPMLSVPESEAFREIYGCFHQIASQNGAEIKASVGKAWNTSETKTIDNAIVGFVLQELQ